MSHQNTAIYPYLNFNGNCSEAMHFYKDALGGILELNSFSDSPMATPENGHLVLHSVLTREGITIMASDCMPGQDAIFGNNVSLSVNCTSKEQADDFFAKLSPKGNITMPLENTFWGAYFGMFTDRFGINWLVNYDAPKED